MANNMMSDGPVKLAVKFRCRRCAGTSVKTYSEPERYGSHRDVWACPHCHPDDGQPPHVTEYEVLDEKFTTGFPDSFGGDFDDLPDSPLTDVQVADYMAVVVEGRTYRRQADERGVWVNTVHENVERAKEKF